MSTDPGAPPPEGPDLEGLSEEELRAAYEAELGRIRVEDVLIQTVVSLLNLAARKAGLTGADEEPDFEQVRQAIDGTKALLPLVEPVLGPDAKQIRDALSQLQLAYARSGATPPAGAGAGGPGTGITDDTGEIYSPPYLFKKDGSGERAARPQIVSAPSSAAVGDDIDVGAAGPAFWLGFAVVLGGQLLVALVLAELASVWPLAGGLYKWTQRLAGARIGWAAGWAYMWTLIVLVTAQCYAVAPFAASLAGIEQPSTGLLLAIGALILLAATAVNWLGPRALKVFVAISISAELLGSVVIGTILLLFFRELPLSAVLGGHGGPDVALAPMLAAVALIGWSFIGFESAGDIAEEVENPRREVPRALVLSLVVVALIVMYAALGLILAVPDLGAAMAGGVADPIAATITAHLGAGVATPLFAMVVLAFIAGIAAVQAAVSRVIFSLARDGELPAAAWLGRLSGEYRLPRNAIAASAVAAAAFGLVTLSENAFATLLSIATVGFYIAFAFPVMASLRVRLRGGWRRGEWNIGRLGLAVNVAAAAWLAFEIVNIAWPRLPDAAWYVNYGALLMVAIVALAGFAARGAMRRPPDRAIAIADGVAVEQGVAR
ncbi:MAG: APC family permease [Actinobacteria bacterium]|nr:APC family permease [Actinomycetota bacterium]